MAALDLCNLQQIPSQGAFGAQPTMVFPAEPGPLAALRSFSVCCKLYRRIGRDLSETDSLKPIPRPKVFSKLGALFLGVASGVQLCLGNRSAGVTKNLDGVAPSWVPLSYSHKKGLFFLFA